MSFECQKCGSELHAINGLCTDRDQMREDQFCPVCNTRYGLRSHGLVVLSEAVDQSAIAKENQELKTTIRTMMAIKSEKAE